MTRFLQLQTRLANLTTLWPNFGGVWERLRQTAKRMLLIYSRLKKTLTWGIPNNTVRERSHLEFTTSHKRPDNEMPLTPNHFLIIRSFNSLLPGKIDSQIPASFRTWKDLQQMMNHFWKRLVEEYLPTLLKRSKLN